MILESDAIMILESDRFAPLINTERRILEEVDGFGGHKVYIHEFGLNPHTGHWCDRRIAEYTLIEWMWMKQELIACAK